MAERRTKGDGSIYQRCSTKTGCPDPIDGKRPPHDCQGRWYGVVDISNSGGGRTRRSVSAGTLKQLRPKLTALQKRTEAGAVGDQTTTVAAWMAYWLDEVSDVRDSTRRTYRGYIETWISPHLGRTRLVALEPEQVRKMLREMEKAGRSNATRRQVLSILSKALKVAAIEGKVSRNVCDTVARPSLAKQETHGVFDLDEVALLLPHIAQDADAARWLTALVLGIRQGEALGLSWDDVHLNDEQPWMHIRQAQDGRTGELGDVKSAASNRIIPVIPPVYAALVAWRDATGGQGLVWGPRNTRTEYGAWQDLLARAGLEPRPLHAARATTASILDRLGATPRQIADILGQSTVHVGQKHYVHSQRDALTMALTRVGEVFTLPSA